jgi:single-stranded-DNA-specific exonuclease
MAGHKILNIRAPDLYLQELFSRELRINPVVAQILANRGINSVKGAAEFLNTSPDFLLDPFTFRDMPKAVDLIRKASAKKDTVLICGDYDVDGLTSVALLKSTFSRLGIQALHYIPHRVHDGYGLNNKVCQFAREKHVKLVVTADCGTSNYEEVKQLRQDGLEVIITDHHELSHSNLPPASCLINPKTKDCPYKFKDLAGVGVAYKLAQALGGVSVEEDMDLVSLGTIADVVPLVGENRIIAKCGLAQIALTKRKGIKALVEVSSAQLREVNSYLVSFILGPRLNASGRVSSAEDAFNLLMSDNKEEADILAKSVDGYNRQRQKIESQILEEAVDLVNKEVNFKDHKVIVVAGQGWHQGVLGIVAAKLADRFYRPTIVISIGDNYCKGSGRSIKNFHLFKALLGCQDLLRSFGGHSHAVGLVLAKENIDDFRSQINILANSIMTVTDLMPSLDIDMELSFAELSEDLAWQIKCLEPFGSANPRPLFLSRNLRVKGQPQLLSRDTLKFWVTDGNNTFSAIGFGLGSLRQSLIDSVSFDLVYTLGIDTWQGNNSLILEVKEIFCK